MPSYYQCTINMGAQPDQNILEQKLKKLIIEELDSIVPNKYEAYDFNSNTIYSKAQDVVLKYDTNNHSLDYKTPMHQGSVNLPVNTVGLEKEPISENNNVNNPSNKITTYKSPAFAKYLVKNSIFKTTERKIDNRYFTNVNFREDDINECENSQQTDKDHNDPSQIYGL